MQPVAADQEVLGCFNGIDWPVIHDVKCYGIIREGKSIWRIKLQTRNRRGHMGRAKSAKQSAPGEGLPQKCRKFSDFCRLLSGWIPDGLAGAD